MERTEATERAEAERVEKKVLLFGFDDLRGILAMKTALDPFGADVVPIGKADYGRTLAAIAGLDTEAAPGPAGAAPAGAVLPGRMAVFCGLDGQLDAILPALARGGAGTECLKAVLTRHNRTWNVLRLYDELTREYAATHRV